VERAEPIHILLGEARDSFTEDNLPAMAVVSRAEIVECGDDVREAGAREQAKA
jgi:hypothetical protein